MPINKVDTKSIADNAVVIADFVNATISNDKLVNTSITIGGKSVSLGGSVTTQDVQWQSVQTSSFNATVGYGYFINTTSAAITMTLPASPTAGNYIAFVDYAGTFATNNLTIARNGNPIQGVSVNSILSTNRAAGLLVYVDATVGWTFVEQNNVSFLEPLFITATGGTITTSGNFKIHTFTGDDSFIVSQVGNNPINLAGGPNAVDYLVVAGGGGGGIWGGGGGGAGGVREGRQSVPAYTASPLVTASGITVTTTTYPVTVGAGGVGQSFPSASSTPRPGSNSTFSTITSSGGGGGGSNPNSSTTITKGGNGGSGGGSASNTNCTGGTGNTPPVSPSQGNNGGNSIFPGAPSYSAGGGGGAGAVGTNASTSSDADGGSGVTTSISGSPTTYGGGGGAQGCAAPTSVGGLGGSGIGGNGAGAYTPGSTYIQGSAGTTNTGSGGGGGGYPGPGAPGSWGGAGGKGIVIIRYQYQ